MLPTSGEGAGATGRGGDDGAGDAAAAFRRGVLESPLMTVVFSTDSLMPWMP